MHIKTETKKGQVKFVPFSGFYVKYFDSNERLFREWAALNECKGLRVQKGYQIDTVKKCIKLEFCIRDKPLLDFDSANRKLFVKLIPKIISAIEHCHSLGWIHGDIKPSNIIYTSFNEDIRLIDFGASQRIGTDRNNLDNWQCTPSFASHNIKMGIGKYLPTDDWTSLIKLIDQFIQSKPDLISCICAKLYKKRILFKISVS